MDAMRTHRRTVTLLAGPGIRAAREVYAQVPADAIRVAALFPAVVPLPRSVRRRSARRPAVGQSSLFPLTAREVS